MPDEYWSVIADEEIWLSTSPEEALDQYDRYHEVDDLITIHKGTSGAPPKPSEFLATVGDSLLEAAYDTYHEDLVEGWEFDVTLLQKHMEKSLDEWFAENKCLPAFSVFKKIEACVFKVTEAKDGIIAKMELVNS